MRLSREEYMKMITRNPSLAPIVVSKPSPIAQEVVEKIVKKSNRRVLADKFEMIWASLHGPKLEPEYKFHEIRKFRVDYCHLKSGVVIELEGSIFQPGKGHTSIGGILRDVDKYNLLTLRGYKLIRLHNRTIIAENLQVIIDFIKTLNPYVSYANSANLK